jgi:hypothetical protein
MCLLQGLLSVKVFFPLFSLAVSFVADIMLVLIAAFGQGALLFLIADNLSESCESHNVLSLIIQPAHTTWSGEMQNTVLEFGVLFEASEKSPRCSIHSVCFSLFKQFNSSSCLCSAKI